MVSLCDGIGGVFACLQRLQLPHDAIVAEADTDLRDFMHQKFPQFEMYAQCNTVTEEVVMKKFTKNHYKGIFLIGGPPCQPFSQAGKQAGFDDHRAAPMEHFCQLAKCLKSRATRENLQFLCLMEQVATMQPQHRDQITHLFGDVPVLIQAADFGWVQRARLYWGAATVLHELKDKAVADWEYMPPGKALEAAGLLRWAGGNVPLHWAPREGWQWQGRDVESSGSVPLPGQQWRTSYKGGRLLTFTTVFPHQADHGSAQADEAQKLRFHQDGRRFPLNTYCADNCVKQGNQMRVLDADERESVMGYPPGWTRGLRKKGQSVEDSRCHAIGNGFHLPSVALLIAILFQFPGTLGHEQIQQTSWAEHHVPGSVFDSTHPGLHKHCTTSNEFMTDVLSMFPPSFFPKRKVDKARSSLASTEWHQLAHWRAWVAEECPDVDVSGPDTDAIQNRHSASTAVSKQRNVAGSKHVPATRLPRDLTAVQHEEAALSLRHPFELPAKLEQDVRFAVEACARLGPAAAQWRYRKFGALRKVARAVAPLDEWALAHRPTRHCTGWAPVFTAALIHLLQWRDRDLPWALVEGFQVVGTIPACGIHRPLEEQQQGPAEQQRATDADLRNQLLGESAVAYVDQLESKLQPHELADEILKATLAEIDLNLARPLETRSQIDEHFGKGQWRPLPRHVIFQGDKHRPIDDAKAGKHNEHTSCSEAIVCCTAEWPAIVARELLRRSQELQQDTDHIPDWYRPRAGTSDMWKGFRQNHPVKDDERFCIITFIDPRTSRRVYSRLRGLPFGMGSVVNQFNRLPALKSAVQRRLLAMMVCHYFDDELTFDMATCADRTFTLAGRLSSMWGIIYSEDKKQRMSMQTDFLGIRYDWRGVVAESAAGYGIKPSTLTKALKLLHEHLTSGSITPTQASKLRGLLVWVDKGITGRPLRGAMTAITARQYWERKPGHALTEPLETALRYAAEVLLILPPRIIPLSCAPIQQIVMYTDAATRTDGALRLGILLCETGKPSLCISLDVPDWVIKTWHFRSTYIGQGELLAVPVALQMLEVHLHCRYITWYIDNTSAASAAIKGASPTEDNSPMALVAALMAAHLGCRIWVEYIASAQNPSDVLSRDAWENEDVKHKLRTGAWERLRQTVDWTAALSLDSAARVIRRWGSRS